MASNKLKVLYIVGWGRSGSTILARIMAQFEDFTHLGELRTLWVDGFKRSSICGCGKSLKDCDVWQGVLTNIFGDIDNIDAKSMTSLRRRSEPHSQDLFKLALYPGQKPKFISRSKEYLSVLEVLYSQIQEFHGSRVIIDDSLHPGYAYVLSCLPNIDIRLLHIVRDPRGSAYSWAKRQKKGLGSYGIKESALGWNLRNAVSELLGFKSSIPYMRVKYENFVKDPEQTVNSILDFINEEGHSSPFISPAEVKLEVTHSVFGNTNRLNSGVTNIRLDEAWKQKMSGSEKRHVTLLTLPMLLRYGYRP